MTREFNEAELAEAADTVAKIFADVHTDQRGKLLELISKELRKTLKAILGDYFTISPANMEDYCDLPSYGQRKAYRSV